MTVKITLRLFDVNWLRDYGNKNRVEVSRSKTFQSKIQKSWIQALMTPSGIVELG